MKIIILCSLLLASAPVFGQNASAVGNTPAVSIEDLNITNGFKTYKFGTPISSMPALKPDGENKYIAPQEPLRIGNVELKSLYFIPYEGKLTTVVFTSVGEENCTELLAMLKSQYGPGLDAGPGKTVWLGSVVTAFYEKQTSISDAASGEVINPPYCTIHLGSTALATAKATKEGARKGARGTKKAQ